MKVSEPSPRGTGNPQSPPRPGAASPRIATAPCRQHAIEWSVASRARPGETVSGDVHIVTRWCDGALIGVIDGLGHGSEATTAAVRAQHVLAENGGQSVIALVQRCHQALVRTRGAVMTLVTLDAREEAMTALGVGNVETMLLRAQPQAKPRRESVLLRGGVVGYQLPALHASVFPIGRGDLVVFATDGVSPDFADDINPGEPVAQLAERIITRKFRGNDDGLVLACRFLGA